MRRTRRTSGAASRTGRRSDSPRASRMPRRSALTACPRSPAASRAWALTSHASTWTSTGTLSPRSIAAGSSSVAHAGVPQHQAGARQDDGRPGAPPLRRPLVVPTATPPGRPAARWTAACSWTRRSRSQAGPVLGRGSARRRVGLAGPSPRAHSTASRVSMTSCSSGSIGVSGRSIAAAPPRRRPLSTRVQASATTSAAGSGRPPPGLLPASGTAASTSSRARFRCPCSASASASRPGWPAVRAGTPPRCSAHRVGERQRALRPAHPCTAGLPLGRQQQREQVGVLGPGRRPAARRRPCARAR